MHYNFQSVYYTGNDLKNNFSQVAAPSEFEVCKGLYSMILYLVIVNDQYTACWYTLDSGSLYVTYSKCFKWNITLRPRKTNISIIII